MSQFLIYFRIEEIFIMNTTFEFVSNIFNCVDLGLIWASILKRLSTAVFDVASLSLFKIYGAQLIMFQLIHLVSFSDGSNTVALASHARQFRNVAEPIRGTRAPPREVRQRRPGPAEWPRRPGRGRAVAIFLQIFGNISLVFGRIGTDLYK